MKKRLTALCLAAAMTASLTNGVYADEESDLRNQVSQQTDSLNNNQEAQNQNKNAQEAVNNEISEIDSKLVDLLASISVLTAQREETQTEVEIKTEELEAAKQQCDEQMEDMQTRIRYIYERDSGMSWITYLAKADSFSDLLNRVYYTQQMNQYDRDQLETYENTVQEITDIKTSLEEKTAQLTADTEALQSQQTELNETLEQKRQESDNYEAEILRLQEEANNLNADIASKNQRIAQIQEEKRQAAEAAAKAEEERRKAQEAEAAQQEASSQETAASSQTTQSSSSSGAASQPSVSSGTTGAPSGDALAKAEAYARQYSDGRYVDRVIAYNKQAASAQRSGIGSELASYALSFEGRLHYVVGGESLSSGADCAGFVCALYRTYGVNLERNLEMFNMLGVSVAADPSAMQPGDIVLYYAGGGIGHAAIYVGNGKIVNESGCYGNGCVNDCCTRAYNYRAIASVRRVFCY